MKRAIQSFFVILTMVLSLGMSSAQTEGGAPVTLPGGQQVTPQQIEIFKQLPGSQQRAIQSEAAKTGGTLTPEAIEALKARPEFQGLTPEDIAKGKAMLERERKESAPEQKEGRSAQERQIIGTEAGEDSLFEQSRILRKYQDVSLNLKRFGYDFFRQAAVQIITDRKDIPVPLKYIIGPGDEVKLLLWGRVNGQYNLTVDRDGKITVPQIGPIFIAGMTFEDMSKHVIRQAEQVVGTNVDISMGSLKTIPVFVLGDVQRPGSYTIGSFATITDILLAAGGPTAIGSMRNIQLKRQNKILAIFDLYNLLLKGDKSKDMTLQAGDIVFIPVTGPMVAVAGNVRRPAIYELKDQYDLQYLFNLAGGIVPTAYTQQIQVERVIKSEKRIIFDIDDKKLERAQAIRLQDADLVKVFSIVDTDVNAIYLHGNVKRPGKYEYKAGMRLKDVIKSMDDILPETYFEYAMIKRLVPPSMDPKLIPFKPELLFADADEKNNLELMPQDNIYIFNQWFFQDRHYATIQGETRGICNVTEVMGSQASPAIGDETKRCFMALTKSTTIKDLILNAGGLTDTAYLERGQLIRVDKNRNYETIYFNVARAMAGDPRENLLIRNEDRVVIHSVWEQVYRRNVNVDGDVNRPGQYQLTDGMTVKDLIFKSGNILESAYVEEAELSSLVTEDRKSSKTERRSINLQKALEGDPDHNLVLRPNDRLFVKKIPDWGIRNIVNISGEVPFPGRYSMHKSEKLSSLLERAGGYTAGAYLRGAIFTRHSVKKLQQEGLEDMANRMERDLLSQSSEVATSLSLEEVKAREVEMQQKKKFIETFRQLKATGRLTIHLANLRILKGSDYDLELEDGDSLHIPPPNRVVNVMGSVMAQASYIYLDKLNYKDYISMAGGYTRYADPAQTFVLKVDGSARKLERKLLGWNEIRTRWEFSNFGEQVKEIEPGDIIVVPERFEHIAWLREIRDITQILMNTAVTAGVVIKLF